MTDTVVLDHWNAQARKLLLKNKKEGPKALEANSSGVKGLLDTIKKEYLPGLATVHQQALERYEELSKSSLEAVRKVNTNRMSKDDGKAVAKKVSAELYKLQMELQLAIGGVNINASPEVREQVLAAKRHKPVYEDKRDRIATALKELRGRPGTSEQVTKLQGLLDAGASFVPDYEEAYKHLKGLTAALKKGRESAEKLEKGGDDKTLQKELVAVRQAIAAYKLVAGIGDAIGVQREEEKVIAALMKIDQAAPPLKTRVGGEVLAELKQQGKELAEKAENLRKLAGEAQTYANRLSPKMKRLRTTATPEVYGRLQLPYNSALSLQATQQYALAVQDFAKVKPDIERDHETLETIYGNWQKADTELKKHQAMVEELAGLPANPATVGVRSVAGHLDVLVRLEIYGELVPGRRFADALALMDKHEVSRNLGVLAKAHEQVKANKPITAEFTDGEGKLRAEVGKIAAPVLMSHGLVESSLNALDAEGGYSAKMREQLAALMHAWELAAGPMGNVSETLDKRNGELDSLRKKAQDIEGQIRVLHGEASNAKKPEELVKSRAAKLRSEREPEFEKMRKLASLAIQYLDDFGAPPNDPVMSKEPTPASLLQRYHKLVASGEFMVDEMDKLKTDAENKRGLMDNHLESLRRDVTRRVDQARQKIEKLKSANKDNEGFFNTLADELTGISGTAGATVIGLINAGIEQLTAFETRLDTHVTEFGKPNGINFARIKERQLALAKALAVKELAEYLPLAHAALETDVLRVLPGRLKTMTPQEGMAELDELERKLKELQDKLAGAKGRYANLGKSAELARQGLQAIATDAPELFKSLKGRIDAAEKAGKGDVDSAELELKTITLLLDSAKDPAKASKMELTVKRDQLQAEQDKIEFEAALDVFEKNIQRQAAGVYDKTDSSERNGPLYGQIEELRKGAVKQAEKGAYTMAREQLRLAESAARSFMENPFVLAVASRKALRQCNVTWQSAISGYLKDVATLRQLVLEGCAADTAYAEEGMAEAAAARLDPLRSLFNAAAFTAATETLAEKPKDVNNQGDRRALKEQAILVVRRYQSVLSENRILRAAEDSPFSPVPLAPLRHALAGYMNALMAS